MQYQPYHIISPDDKLSDRGGSTTVSSQWGVHESALFAYFTQVLCCVVLSEPFINVPDRFALGVLICLVFN